MSLRRFLPRLVGLRNERGSSIVETAIVAPVFVTLVFWAAFFYDFVQIRIKLLEATRFSAWEFTAYPLSDYQTGNHGGAYGTAADDVGRRAKLMYDSLNSEDEAGPAPRLTVDYQLADFTFTNERVDVVNAGGFTNLMPGGERTSVANSVLDTVNNAMFFMLGVMEFNREGLVTATQEVTITHKLLPAGYHTNANGGFFSQSMYDIATFTLTEKVAVVADGWTLHEGQTVLHTDTGGGFYNMIQNGHMLNKLSSVPILGRLAAVIDAVGDFVEDFFGIPSFTNPRLASKIYEQAGNADRIPLDTDEWQDDFHTLPAQEVCTRGNCPYPQSLYQETLRKRGLNYMGCPVPQSAPGTCRWNN